MCRPIKYPVGEQSFEQLRKGGFLYVDKTRYVETVAKGPQYLFLGRPRRFGKSLFLSTLQCFFEGKRELFKGLYIDSTDWDWEPFPVLLLDFNNADYTVDGGLENIIEKHLRRWEREYGIEPELNDYALRFEDVIEAVYKKTGRNIVILVDEYDKPLIKNLNDRERFERYRETLAALYSNFKSSARYIRLVFLTGVTRFGKLSVFSGLNNISDISFDDDYAGICGITESELLENFSEGIATLAEEHAMSKDDMIGLLKHRYDGYHFAEVCPDIYNPYSLLETFSKRKFRNYWIDSGVPTLLAEQLKRDHTDLTELESAKGDATDLSGLDLDSVDPVALFYQTGYLTIKGYDEFSGLFQLGYPNEEVAEGFYRFLLPYYSAIRTRKVMSFIVDLVDDFRRGDVEGVMTRLQSLFAGLAYDLQIDAEKDVRNALLIVFRLVRMMAEAEYRTSDGRIDILVCTPQFIYIMELKFNKTAEEALEQIRRKEYHLPWAIDNRTVIAIGINYSSDKRRIDAWASERL